jgi:cytochrome P450
VYACNPYDVAQLTVPLNSIMQPDWSYRLLREPWDRLGDNFLVVSPFQTIIWTSSAEAIHQITSRRENFPKDTSAYEILAIFGRNMLTTEGAEWKMHRKGVSPSFNERNAAYIFGESIHQTQGLISQWMGDDSHDSQRSSSATINTIEHDTMTLALNIIAHVGFGLRFFWPGQKMPDDLSVQNKKYASFEPPEGHSLTFVSSLAMVLERILLLLLVPQWLLRYLPSKATKEALDAYQNYDKYMQEFLEDKIEEAHRGASSDGMDIMGQLVRATYGKKGKSEKKTDEQLRMTDEMIKGNAFIIIVAGHETTANTLHFTLCELANNPAAQRALQADVDRLFGHDSDPLAWNYEKSINALCASNVAACMNEALRLIPSVVDIPKYVTPGQDQAITLDGDKHVLPEKGMILLNTVGVHRNPKYWPTKQKSGPSGELNDLDDFLPERWYRPSLSKAAEAQEEEDTEDFGGFKGRDTSEQLYRPVRGSFIPFSDGARSCLGRRIAQVEMLAALAVLFQKYSIELAVDEWASDEEVAGMSVEERKKVYEKARAKSRDTIRQATSMLTLKLHGKLKVPVRLVKRGEERFVNAVDV